jgi:hypothetical protein
MDNLTADLNLAAVDSVELPAALHMSDQLLPIGEGGPRRHYCVVCGARAYQRRAGQVEELCEYCYRWFRAMDCRAGFGVTGTGIETATETVYVDNQLEEANR